MIVPDGITAAAVNERTLHPTTDKGKPITAWDRRAVTLNRTVAEVNVLRDEVDELKALAEDIRSRPF